MAIFVTSDLHFNHDKDFIYQARGFSSIEEHDKILIENWNQTITNNDDVYLLGDLIMGADRQGGLDKLNALNGKIHFIMGNHDTNAKVKDYLAQCPHFIEPASIEGNRYANMLIDKKWMFFLSHYPTIVGNLNLDDIDGHESRHPSKLYALHGHTHSNDRFEYFEFKCYNVAVDAHNMRPVSLEEIKNDIRQELEKRIKLAGGFSLCGKI